MQNRYRLIIFLLFYFVLSIYPAYITPLFETTEARYGEIAREMIVNHDYLEPRLNGIKHFHKPPLPYWIIGAGIKIFGVNNFGARFFSLVAAIISIIFTYRIAGFFLNKDDSIYAAYIFGSSLLFLGVSKLVSTDIYLTMFVVITQYFYFKQIYERKSLVNAILIGLFMGLGFMSKGPIIFLFTLLPYFIAKIFFLEYRKVFDARSIMSGAMVFLLVGLPWYIAVMIKNPELFHYFLKVQTVDRVATDRFNRTEPFYYFFIVLFLSFLPYSIYVFRGLFRFKSLNNHLKIMYLFIIAPFIVFTISKSKLSTYILPFYPIMCVLTYNLLKRYFTPRSGKIFFIILLASIALTFSVAGFVYSPLRDYRVILFIMTVTYVLLLLYMLRTISLEHFVRNLAFFFIIFVSSAYLLIEPVEKQINGFQKMAKMMNDIDPQRKTAALVYKNTIPSISFYRNSLVAMANGKTREVQFEDNRSYKDYYFENSNEIEQFILKNQHFFLISREKDYTEFKNIFQVQCKEEYSQRKATLYLCKK
jgi:4-amino-4-deoxy-L-arabinose transferase